MSAQDKFQYYLAQVDKELSKYPQLNKLEQQTQIPKAYGVIALGTTFVSLIFFNIFAGFLSNALGFAVPAYLSLRALESPGHEDDTQWLTYWVVFGLFNFIESILTVVAWFPYYYLFKTSFIIWLIMPQTRGAVTMYHKVLGPMTSQLHTKPSAAPASTGVAGSQ